MAGLLLALLSASAQDISPLETADRVTPPLDPHSASLLRSLHPPAPHRLHPVIDRIPRVPVRVEISLAERRLRVLSGRTVALEAPVSVGRSGRESPAGEFALESKVIQPKGLEYGRVLDAAGTVLMRGFFPRHDPLPAGATFEPVVPKCGFRLTEGGPLIFAGEATGAATTDGSIVIPEKIALLLYDKLPAGTAVVIRR